MLNNKCFFPILCFFILPLLLIGQSDTTTARIYIGSAYRLVDSARYDQAEELGRKALTTYEKTVGIEDMLTAKAYLLLGQIFIEKQVPDSIFYYADKAIVILEKEAGVSADLAAGYMRRAKGYEIVGKFDKSIESEEKALVMHLDLYGKKHPKIADNYKNIGAVYGEKGKYDESISYLQTALSIQLFLFGSHHQKIGESYNDFGIVYQSKGDYDKAIMYYQKALDIQLAKLGSKHSKVGVIYNNLGVTHYLKGNFEKTIDYFQKSLAIQIIILGDKHPKIGDIYNNLGVVCRKKGDYEKAIEYYEKDRVIQIAVLGKTHHRIGNSYNNIGIVYQEKGDYIKAIECYEKALDIQLAALGNDHPKVTDIYYNFGDAYNLKGDYEKAIEYYKKVLVSATTSVRIASSQIKLGVVYTKKKDFTKAAEYLEKATNLLGYNSIYSNHFSQVSNLLVLREWFIVKAKYYKTLLSESQNASYSDSLSQHYSHAILLEDYLQKQLSDGSKSFHIENAYLLYEDAIAHLVQRGGETDLKKAFAIAEKGKSRFLQEHLRVIGADNFTGLSSKILEEHRELNKDIATIEQQRYEAKYETKIPNDSLVEVYTDQLFNLKRKKDDFLAVLKANHPKYYKLKHDYSTATVSEIQAKLLPGRTIVEYFVGNNSIFIYVITKENYIVKEIQKDFPLEDWVKDFRTSIYAYWISNEKSPELYQQNNTIYVDLAFRLYQKLIAPVQNILTEKLIIIPDGILNLLPFDALLMKFPKHDPNELKLHHYFLKNHQISYHYAATLWVQDLVKKQNHAAIPLLAFAPAFGDLVVTGVKEERIKPLNSLYFNLSEAQNIHTMIGGDLRTKDEATEDQFKKIAKNYRILHLATHSKANDLLGDYSYIAFTEISDSTSNNERLYVKELYNMELAADMAVLSGCESGVGKIQKGEGIISLSRAFAYAGAKSTVISLWNINDLGTLIFMKYFYKNIKSGMSKDAALRSAKLSMLEETNHIAPYFWASFIPIGNMSPIKFEKPNYWIKASFLTLFLLLFGFWIYKKRLSA